MCTNLHLSDPSSLRSQRLLRTVITVLEFLTPGGTIYSRYYVVSPLDGVLLLTMVATPMVAEQDYMLIRLQQALRPTAERPYPDTMRKSRREVIKQGTEHPTHGPSTR